MKTLSRMLAVLFLFITASAARANLFSFNASGSGQTVTGTLTANATGTAGQFLITSISGTLTGVTISGLLPVNGFDGNDNLLMMSGTNYLPDSNGFSFSLANNTQANLFTFPTAPFAGQQFLARSDGTLAAMTTFQINAIPTPELSSWMLLGTGLAGVAGTIRRRVAAAL